MPDDDSNITKLEDHRRQSVGVYLGTLPPPASQPDGPFTVTISAPHGKMFEVTFPDFQGVLPDDVPALGTAGCQELLINLMCGAMRVYCGAR